MSNKTKRSFQRESADVRRQSLIDATLDIIGEAGFDAATVREITQRADVTQGLVRHYFSTKGELVSAAYDCHMSQMTALALNPDVPSNATEAYRLAAIVRANLTPPVMAERNLTLWAAFLGKLSEEDYIRKTHERTYLQFREGLAAQIKAALLEVGRNPNPALCRQLAISCNALIDGLWIEGSALHLTFDGDEVVTLGLRTIGTLVGIDLEASLQM
jgi:AcrR family transcriptional regulator